MKLLRQSVFFLTVIVVVGIAGVAFAEKRVALVIGNSNYKVAPLANPVNDAKLMVKTLRGLGFDVLESMDADQQDMKLAVTEFGDKLEAAGKDAVGLFYYAGHGIQVGGTNYLIPIGANINREKDVDTFAVSANAVLRNMEFAGNRVNIVIMDACRNNPFKRSFRSADRGLAKMNAATGTLIGYATAPGEVAADGDGANSPYTLALSRSMNTPGLTVERMFKQVRNDVRAETDNQQTPWEASSLTGADFYFKGGASTSPQTTTNAVPPQQRADIVAWQSINKSTNPKDFETFIEAFPESPFSKFARNKISDLSSQQTALVLPPKPLSQSDGTPKEQYKKAFELLRLGKYQQAQVVFAKFINNYANDPLTSNARYWLGESLYVQNKLSQAAEVFLESYQKDSKGAKAPDSLLKLGMSLARLQKKQEACSTFDKLKRDFTNLSYSIRSMLDREKQKNGCSNAGNKQVAAITPGLRINKDKPKFPMPIAIPSFIGSNSEETGYGRDIARVIAADLERSGLFRPIDQRAFIRASVPMNTLPRFGDWRIIAAKTLAHGGIKKVADGRLKVEFRLWDLNAEQQMVGLAYFTVPENWRRVAHIVADAIYKRVTGSAGNFDSRIIYIAEKGPPNKQVKRLAIMDQDGENHRFLTDGKYKSATPRFSPTLQEITYQSDYRNRPRVYIFNIDTGRQEVLGDFEAKTFDPRFSPNGETVIMSMIKNGNADIYTMDLRTRAVRKLVSHSANDTSPGYSPDGKWIVFNSDRDGAPQIYVMNADGNGQKRISFGKGIYLTPAWSHRGDLIAFSKKIAGRTYIGVMRPDGSGEKILAEGQKVASPSWSPNGHVLIYSKSKNDKSRLYRVNVNGDNELEVATPIDASEPNWSRSIP